MCKIGKASVFEYLFLIIRKESRHKALPANGKTIVLFEGFAKYCRS